MPRIPRRFRASPPRGRTNRRVFFPKVEMFQEWYQGIVNAEPGRIVNVPIGDLAGNIWWSAPGCDWRSRGASVLLC